MNHLLRPRIWPSFLASSGVGPCDVPFRYASESIPRCRGTVARWHAHLRGLATAMHEISGLEPTEAYIDTVWWSIGGFTLSVASLLLPWRSTGIDLAFYY